VQVACAIALMLTFFAWAPWNGAQPLSEAPPEVVAALPASCPAVVVNHGHYSCYEFGTIASNPVGYAAMTALFFGLFGLFLFIGLTGRGIWDNTGERPNKSLERTREG
jgi:hypothetical protein